jgi:formylglycine-generating enzyme required for sulfatase activity
LACILFYVFAIYESFGDFDIANGYFLGAWIIISIASFYFYKLYIKSRKLKFPQMSQDVRTKEINNIKRFQKVYFIIAILISLILLGISLIGVATSPIFQGLHPESTKGGRMLSVPAGEFMMGCNEQADKQCQSNEKPYHKVYLDAFYIDKFLVTQAEYDECVASENCLVNKKYDDFTDNHQPVVGISWEDAKTYCKWAGKRLPTEAEWEKAARGTDGRIYPWGNSIDPTRANYKDSVIEKTTKVGTYPSAKSPYGAYDMAGNAWEWVADWYGENYYRNSPSKNPGGPDSGKSRVMRGGGWGTNADYLRASFRNDDTPADQNHYGGFRCARDGVASK